MMIDSCFQLFVASNYRSAFTNIFFVRNTAAGRALVVDWLSIIMSGRIHCHGFDQAALAMLILQRLHGGPTTMTEAPFNYTCQFSEDGAMVINFVLFVCLVCESLISVRL